MTGDVLVVVLALASALAFALSAVLKHSTATRVPELAGFNVRALWRFGVATVLHPLWLLGLVADAVGLVLQVVALHVGAISVVQPLLSVGLLFALVLRHAESRTIPGAEIPWAVLLIATLIGFLFVGDISSADAKTETVHRPAAVVGAIIAVLLVGGCVIIARRVRTMRVRTTSLGIAVGVLYAVNAALIKTCTQKFSHGIPELLTSWAPYAFVVVGVSGVLLCQLAYQAGPLVASQPTIAVIDPLASVAVGLIVYAEALRHGWWVVPSMVVLLALMSVSIAKLATVDAAPAHTPALEPTGADR